MKDTLQAIFGLLIIVATIAITFLIGALIASWICNIHPGQEYGWLAGIWHGWFFPINWVRSWFSDALFKAELHTTAYNIWFWICSIQSVLTLLGGGRAAANRK